MLHACRYLTNNFFCARTSLLYNYTMYRRLGYNHGWFPRGPYGPWGGAYPYPGFYPPLGIYPSPGFYPPLGIYPPPPIYPPFFR